MKLENLNSDLHFPERYNHDHKIDNGGNHDFWDSDFDIINQEEVNDEEGSKEGKTSREWRLELNTLWKLRDENAR